MKAVLRACLAAVTAFAGLAPIAAHAGGGGNCHCSPPPPPCNCTVPTGHQVTIPGVDITPPSITVNSPSITVSAPSVDVQTTAVAISQASAQATGTASAEGMSYANLNALAAANAYTAGGGGGFSSAEGGGTTFIPNLNVVGVEAPETRRICAEWRASARMVAVQAVCLDDKAVPHPASQVMPDHEVLPIYEGEVYRCIAGTRMQYTLADYAGAADFTHGQTVTCQKGEALYHAASGELACRPQRPARDCNERSLLRRYGAGIKVLKMSVARQCVSWSTETASAATTSAASESIAVDGGVGGVTR